MVAAELLLSRDAPRFIDLVECRKVEGNLEEIMPESKLTLPPDAAARLRMLESEPQRSDESEPKDTSGEQKKPR